MLQNKKIKILPRIKKFVRAHRIFIPDSYKNAIKSNPHMRYHLESFGEPLKILIYEIKIIKLLGFDGFKFLSHIKSEEKIKFLGTFCEAEFKIFIDSYLSTKPTGDYKNWRSRDYFSMQRALKTFIEFGELKWYELSRSERYDYVMGKRHDARLPALRHIKNKSEYENMDFTKYLDNENRLKVFDAMNDFGVNKNTIYRKFREAGIKYNKWNRKSASEMKFLDDIDEMLGYKIARDFKIDNLYPDGYDPKTNTIYEFLGDYWHGRSNDDTTTYFGKTSKDLYRETFDRFQKLMGYGYKVIYIWERDYLKDGLKKLNNYNI